MESFFRFLSSLVPWDILLGWLLIAILLSLVHALELEKGKAALAALSLGMFGFVLGGLTALPAPELLLRPLPILGTSVVVVPLILGLALHGLGKIWRARGKAMSHVATWYGGAALGLGLALGRLTAVGMRS